MHDFFDVHYLFVCTFVVNAVEVVWACISPNCVPLQFSVSPLYTKVWGFTDRHSWKASSHPCLYDANYVAKPAVAKLLTILSP